MPKKTIINASNKVIFYSHAYIDFNLVNIFFSNTNN